MLGLRFGAAAVRAIAAGQLGSMVALDPPDIKIIPLDSIKAEPRLVPLDGDVVMTARDVGVSLGD